MIEFGVLGPLEVGVEGEPVRISSRKVRAVLAMLLLRANEVVSTPRIISGLWGTQPPKAARESVHYYIFQLRNKVLPREPDDRQGMLESHGGGYLLRVPSESIDLARFTRLAEQARRAQEGRDLQAAWARYGEALGLWRGFPLEDLTAEPFAAAEIAGLEELRVAAAERRLEVGLELGWEADLVGEIEALVVQQPRRERLYGLWMRALYRCGRQAEALEVYQTARTRLGELGLEPATELAGLQHQILNHDPGLLPHPRVGVLSPIDHAAPPRLPPASPEAAAPTVAKDSRRSPTGTPEPLEAPPAPQRSGRRVVSVVTVAYPPAAGDRDPEEARAFAQTLQAAIREAAGRYGGSLPEDLHLPLLGPVAFGLAGAREDDPERAVRAALEIAAASPTVRCAVICGVEVVPADPSMVTYLAAQEGARALLYADEPSGGVLVDQVTYQRTRWVIDYQPATSGGWQALRPRPRPGISAPADDAVDLVEREAELARLHEVYRQTMTDPWVRMVTVLGAPGIGKTRLVAELGKQLDAAPELVAWRAGRPAPPGQEDGLGGAFWALAEIVTAEAGIGPDDPPADITGKLARAVAAALGDDPHAETVTQALRVLLRQQPAASDPEEGLLEGWRRFLYGLARRRPLVLVVEDLHRADDAMLDFLQTLMAAPARVPLLVVATARPELLTRRPAWPGSSRHAHTVELPPLSTHGAAVLLKALTDRHHRTIPEPRKEALLAAAAGNPLFLTEFVRAPGTEVPLMPATLTQLLTARIDATAPTDRYLLQCLAVVGEVDHPGALDLLAGLTEAPLAEVTATLARLQAHDLLRATRPLPGTAEVPGYQFTHALLRDVAYDQLLRADRARLHQQTADYFRQAGDQGAEQAAHHYRRALRLARDAGLPEGDLLHATVAALEAAGDVAVSLTALGTAGGYFQQALDLLTPDGWEPGLRPTRARLLYRHGEVARLGGDLDVAKQRLTQAADLYDQLKDGQGATRARGALGLLHAAQASQPPPASDQAPADPLLAHAYQAAALMAAWDNQGAVTLGEQVMAEADDAGRRDAWARAAGARGYALARLGDIYEGRELWRAAIGVLESLGSPGDLLEARYAKAGLAVLHHWAGDLDQLAAAIQPAAAESAWDATVLAAVGYHTGRWAKAPQLLEQALGPDPAALTFLGPWALTLRGRIRLGRGDLDGALADAHAAADAAQRLGHPEHGDRHWRHTALGLAARAQTTASDPDAARATLNRLLSELRADPTGSGLTADAALAIADLALPAADLPVNLIETRWQPAITAMTAHDFHRAADAYARIGAGADAADANLRAARDHARRGEGDQARAALETAVVFYTQAEASAYLQTAAHIQQQLASP